MEAKYDSIGVDYNLTRRADPYLTARLWDHLSPKEGGLYLDVGCGTGNYTHELHKRGLRFIGIDPSKEMLDKARLKTNEIEWRTGTAEKTSLADNSIDGIICTLTIHHWHDLDRSFAELGRVLKDEGRIVLFTSTPEQMQDYWLNHFFPAMLEASIRQMPSLERVEQAMAFAGFEVVATEKYFVQLDLQDHFLYCGKHSPELYFQEEIRNGISSFSSLAHRKEVDLGLAELRKAIDNLSLQAIMDAYWNERGDYLFIVGQINKH